MLTLLLCLLPQAHAAPVFGYTVVHRLPHNPSSYTEGLFFENGLFIEGTGLEGHSALLITDPSTGRTLQQADLPANLFGEGVINVGSTLLQWTWQSHRGFVYDRRTLHLLRTFTYTGEGWGITRDAHHLITSDGTSTLTLRDPATFAPIRTLTVHDGPTLIDQLNELEYIDGEIYANVWHSDRIARISPTDGHVLSWIDCTGLFPQSQRPNGEAVLNGIAWDPLHHRLFVTGKQWPTIFEIRLTPPH